MPDQLHMIDILKRAYRWMNQGSTTPPQYAEQVMGEFINDTYQDLLARMRQSHQLYALATYDFSVTTNPQTFDLPTNCYQRRALVPWSSTKPSSEYPLQRLDPSDSPFRWGRGYLILENNQIQFWNVGTGTIRLYYERSIANLTCGIATAADATSITLSAAPSSDTVGSMPGITSISGMGETSLRADEYNGEKIMIVSATTNGNRQYAEITDYSGATRIATVASWPGGTPATNIIYSILPVIPEEFQNLLVYGSILGLVDGTYLELATRRYNQLFKGFEDFLDSEDDSTPLLIKDTDGELPTFMNEEGLAIDII